MTDFRSSERQRCPNLASCGLLKCPGAGRFFMYTAGEDVPEKVLVDTSVCMAGLSDRRDREDLLFQEAGAMLGDTELVDGLVREGAERLVTVIRSADQPPAFDPSMYGANLIRFASSEDAA